MKLNVHGTMTNSSVLTASTVHVLSKMGLLSDEQPAVALPPTRPPVPVHSTTAT